MASPYYGVSSSVIGRCYLSNATDREHLCFLKEPARALSGLFFFHGQIVLHGFTPGTCRTDHEA
jgi:hypothetical protein